jgi:hypothetical protein
MAGVQHPAEVSQTTQNQQAYLYLAPPCLSNVRRRFGIAAFFGSANFKRLILEFVLKIGGK